MDSWLSTVPFCTELQRRRCASVRLPAIGPERHKASQRSNVRRFGRRLAEATAESFYLRSAAITATSFSCELCVYVQSAAAKGAGCAAIRFVESCDAVIGEPPQLVASHHEGSRHPSIADIVDRAITYDAITCRLTESRVARTAESIVVPIDRHSSTSATSHVEHAPRERFSEAAQKHP